jgi:hypothetical protein
VIERGQTLTDYLETAVCVVKYAPKGLRFITVPRHLPGNRDCYNPETADNSEIFRSLAAEGSKIEKSLWLRGN